MKRCSTFLSVLVGALLFAIPVQSEAFFGFFGGGFSFGFGFGGGWNGWGGPGWWGPGYWGGPGWWGPADYWYRPYFWPYYRPGLWGYPPYALTLPYAYGLQPVLPKPQAPTRTEEK